MKRLLLVCILSSAACIAQTESRPGITLSEAIRRALEHYPSIRVSQMQVEAAAAGVRLARTAYLPRIDSIAQVNRATRNNVFGLLLPQSVISPISGPPLASNDLTSVWGSAVGVLVSWEAFDFGLRSANIETADRARLRAEAGVARSRFELANLVADSYLTLAAAEHITLAAQAGVERADVLSRVAEALVRSELRPGVDASRATAEQASAQAQVIRAEQAVTDARELLAQLTGLDKEALQARGAALSRMPAETVEAARRSVNPLLTEQNAAIEEGEARLAAVERSYFPRIQLQATTYARGTGALPDGGTRGGVTGLGPNIHNWAAGFTATFPLFELPAIRARRSIEEAKLRGEQNRYEVLRSELAGERKRAQASLEAARRIALTTPTQLEAARAASRQATARYQAGLANVVEVADTQRLLTQSEIDDALARLGVWRAMLRVAAVEGDLTPFLTQLGQ